MPPFFSFFSSFKLYPSKIIHSFYSFFLHVLGSLIKRIEEKTHMRIIIFFDALAVASLLLTLLKVYVYLVFSVQLHPLENFVILIILFLVSLKFQLILIVREIVISISKDALNNTWYSRYMAGPIKFYLLYINSFLGESKIEVNIKNFKRLFPTKKGRKELWLHFIPRWYFAFRHDLFIGFFLSFIVFFRLSILAEPILFVIINFLFFYFLMFNKLLLLAYCYSFFLSFSRILFLAFDYSVSNMYNKLNKYNLEKEILGDGENRIKITWKNVSIIGIWLCVGHELHYRLILQDTREEEEENIRAKEESYKVWQYEKEDPDEEFDITKPIKKENPIKEWIKTENLYFMHYLEEYNELVIAVKESEGKDAERHRLIIDGGDLEIEFKAYKDLDLISFRYRTFKNMDLPQFLYREEIHIELESPNIHLLKGLITLIGIYYYWNFGISIEEEEINIELLEMIIEKSKKVKDYFS